MRSRQRWRTSWVFLSTLSLRRATVAGGHRQLVGIISIHALLAESDGPGYSGCTVLHHFYPRSPCGERRRSRRVRRLRSAFLSTLSLRRATPGISRSAWPLQISIHALLAESDLYSLASTVVGWIFLSTLSLRRATHPIDVFVRIVKNFYPRSPCGERRGFGASRPKNSRISIHALLAESDYICKCSSVLLLYFYPRSPCGERHQL